MFNHDRRFWLDVIERCAWTFAEAFGALWLGPVAIDVLNGASDLHGIWLGLTNFDVLDKAAVGGIAAVLMILKGTVIAPFIGSRRTAATLPVTDDTPRPAG